MEPITIIEGSDLKELLSQINDLGHIYRLRVHQTHDGRAKFKVNEGMWSPGLGERDGE